MDSKSRINKIANRIITSYMALKIPVGYSIATNTKHVLMAKFGCEFSDEQIEEIFARFLDVVVFGLIRDTNNVGSGLPQAEDFYNIAYEVYQQDLQQEQEDADDEIPLDRWGDQLDPTGQSGGGDLNDMGLEVGGAPKRF